MPRPSQARFEALRDFSQALQAYVQNPAGNSLNPIPNSATYYATRFFYTPIAPDDATKGATGTVVLELPARTDQYAQLYNTMNVIAEHHDLTSLHSVAPLYDAIRIFINEAKQVASKETYKDERALRRTMAELRYRILGTVADGTKAMMTYPNYADEVEAEQKAIAAGGTVRPRQFNSSALRGMEQAGRSVGQYLAVHTAALMDVLFNEEPSLTYNAAVKRARFSAQNDFKLPGLNAS